MTTTESKALEAARVATAKGIRVIPIPYKQKRPVIEGWPDLRLTEEQLPQYFNGQPMNVGGLWGEASGGIIDIDLDDDITRRLAPHFLPETHAIYGRESSRRSHYLYRCIPLPPEGRWTFSDPLSPGKEATLLELRSNGHQSVLPGSVHSDTGEAISWDDNEDIRTYDPPVFQERLSMLASAALLARYWPGEGVRQDTALALCGGLYRLWKNKDKVRDFFKLVLVASSDNEKHLRLTAVETTEQQLLAEQPCTGWKTLCEYIDEKIVNKVREWLGAAEDVYSDQASQREVENRVRVTDVGNAERFSSYYENELCWVPEERTWRWFNGAYWERVDENFVVSKAKLVASTLWDEARELYDAKEDFKGKKMAEWAAKSHSIERLRAMVGLAKGDMTVKRDKFDDVKKCIYKLNVLNGTLNLRTGKLEPHNPLDYNTRMAPVEYDPDAPYPRRWTNHLKWCFNGDQQMYWYIHKLISLSCTGDAHERVIPDRHGDGNNGKSVVIAVVALILGGYAMKIAKETLLQKQFTESGGNASPDIANLKGKRFVYTTETNEGETLDVAKMKDWTGNEKLSCRRLYSEPEEFFVEFMLWISSNHKLRVPETKPAIWNRLRLILYSNTIAKGYIIKDLAEQIFAEEASGILNWIVEGVQWYLDEGINEPESVVESTLEYRNEQDTFKRLFPKLFAKDAEAHMPRTRLWEHYQLRLTDFTYGRALKRQQFYEKLEEMGFRLAKIKGTNADGYIGLKPLTETPEAEFSFEEDAKARLIPLAKLLYRNAVCTEAELAQLDPQWKEDLEALRQGGWVIVRTSKGYALDVDQLSEEIIKSLEAD